MRYVTITTWELTDGADFDLTMEKVEARRLPALKELGAERAEPRGGCNWSAPWTGRWRQSPSGPTRPAAVRRRR